jgi:hypothetical protein
MKMIFPKVWQLRGHELRQWLFYNVVLGLLPVWLAWFCLSLAKTFRFSAPFLDGTFLVFTATLSGASLGFFTAEDRASLPKTERLIFAWLLIVLVLGAAGFSAITVLKEFAPGKSCDPIVFGVSAVILAAAIWFNLNVAAVRLVSGDRELKAQLVEEPQKVMEKAKAANEVDGVKL